MRTQTKQKQRDGTNAVAITAALAKKVKALAVQKGRTRAQQRYRDKAQTLHHHATPPVRFGARAAAHVVVELLAANHGVATTDALERATARWPYGLQNVRRDLGLVSVRFGNVCYIVDIEPPARLPLAGVFGVVSAAAIAGGGSPHPEYQEKGDAPTLPQERCLSE